MKLKTLIDLCLTEGIAENAGQICFDINKLNNYLNKTKKQKMNFSFNIQIATYL